MSPALLRRYRAERLLRREFDVRREKVLANVRGRLRARGVTLDNADLEECYAQAWQGLYTALLQGDSVENISGWLTVVCFRRAIDEHRVRRHEQQLLDGPLDGPVGHFEPDLAGDLDDRTRLRHTFEALRKRLDERERQAASLCYLQGLSRAQAAAQMGISEARMRKLMEGRGPGRPGVAAKVDELLQTIRGGGWCEQQASLMRALAFGILDPDGERYRLAELHRRECPACRAYVLSLRGIAAVLPPLVLPLGPLAAGIGGAASAGAGAGTSAGAGTGAGAGAGTGASSTAGGALSGSGVAGLGGAAGGGATGGWLPLGGSLAAKLATGCLLVAGVGGGCVALIAGSAHSAHAAHRHDLASGRRSGGFASDAPIPMGGLAADLARRSSTRARRAASSARLHAAGQSQRELGFERAPAAGSSSARTTGKARTTSSPSQLTQGAAASSNASDGATGEFGVR